MDDRGVSGCVSGGVFLGWPLGYMDGLEDLFDGMPARRAEAGFRPGGRPTFLSRDRSAGHKKVGKETRPNARDPCASLRGNLRRGGCGEWGRAVAALGLGFEAGFGNASMISVAPCSGAGA